LLISFYLLDFVGQEIKPIALMMKLHRKYRDQISLELICERARDWVGIGPAKRIRPMSVTQEDQKKTSFTTRYVWQRWPAGLKPAVGRFQVMEIVLQGVKCVITVKLFFFGAANSRPPPTIKKLGAIQLKKTGGYRQFSQQKL
jgi:hypothetical protein